MLAKTLISFAALAASVSAILVTSPTKDAKVDFSKDVTITWTSVNTDPSTFTLELVDQSNVDSPIVINKEVKTSDNKYTLSNFVAPTGSTYKFNFLSNDPMNSGILAQSQSFEIVKSGAVSSSSSSSESTTTSTSTSSAEPTVVTTPVTGTVTTTNSAGVTTTMETVSSKTSTASATAESTGADASSTASASATPSNAAVVLDKTFAIGGGLLAALLMAF